jgi:FXSXX-COOH protein
VFKANATWLASVIRLRIKGRIMVLTDELRPAYPSSTVDLRDIPLAEMPALSLDVLGRTIGRVLPDPSANPVPVAAFQSSI